MNRTVVVGVGLTSVGVVLGTFYYGRAAMTQRPSPLLLIPVVLLISLGVTMLFADLMARRGIRPLADVATVWPRTRAVATVTAAALISIGLCGFGTFFLNWNVVTEWAILETAVLGLLLFATLTVGWINLRRAMSLPAEEMTPIQHLLEKQPEQIAWAYKIVVASQAAPVNESEKMSTVCLWLANGRSHQTSLPAGDAEALLTRIRERAPHAPIGYDAAIEAQYRQDPTCFMPSSR